MAEIHNLSTLAASNTARFPENMQFRNVNDSARELEAMIARHHQDTNGSLTSAGTGGAYSVTTNRQITSLFNGLRLSFTANHATTGAATLNVNGLGVISLFGSDGAALDEGDIIAGQVVDVVYKTSSSVFQMTSGVNVSSSVSDASLKVGDVVLTLDTTPKAGRIRLTESTQAVIKSAYPELDAWASAMSYPWGSATTTFNLPSAAGYFLRFAPTSTAIDTSGARTAGSTQTDQNKTHAHTGSTAVTTTTSSLSLNNNTGIHEDGSNNATAGTGAPTDNGFSKNATQRTMTGSVASTSSTVLTIAADGGDEVRVKNVAMHADLIASPAAANASIYGVNGVPYIFDSGTASADPGAGRLRVNNATLASATALYISESGSSSEALADWIGTWDDSDSTTKGHLHFYKIGAAATFAIFSVTGSITDNGSYRSATIAHVSSSGTLSNNDPIGVLYYRTGNRGDAGPAGGGVLYAFSTTTTDADPGAGTLRFNNATLASVTEIYIDTSDSGGTDVTTWLDSLDNSTSPTKGTLQIVKSSTPSTVYALFDVTAVTSAAGYRKLAVTYVSGPGGFAASDGLGLVFMRAGDIGATGVSGTDGGLKFLFDSSTTTNADPGTGDYRLNHATLASVTEIAISYSTAESGNPSVETFVKSWDDSSTTALRGTLVIKKTSAPQNFAIYNITSAITDGTTYGRFTLAHVSSSGSLSNTDNCSVQFYRTGNSGAGSGDLLAANNLNDVANAATAFANIKQAASTTTTGVLELATQAEAGEGTSSSLAVAPNGLFPPEANVASASTTDLGAVTSIAVNITGSTTITSFGTANAGIYRRGRFSGALTLTHNATTLILPGSTSITTAANDRFGAVSLGSGNWLVLWYERANGKSTVAPAWSDVTSKPTTLSGFGITDAMAQGKHTVWIPAAAMVPRSTNGAAIGTVEMTTNLNMFRTLDFDATTAEYAQFEIGMPKSWNEGTVTFEPVWTHAATTTNFGVVWELAAVALSNDDVGDVAFGTAQSSTDTGGTTNDRYTGPESSAITIAGTPAEGDVVQFQINRAPANGSDTMAIDARLHGVRLFLTTNAATDA